MIADIIHRRRTHKRFDGSDVPKETLEALLATLQAAPNHRLTRPWRCYVLEQPAVRALGDWITGNLDALLVHSAKPEKDRAKVEKLAGHYLASIGAIIQVTQVIADDDLQDWEDHAAVSAGVQNLLLAAEAEGLASFWSSAALLRNPVLARHLGSDPDSERFVASIWLGGKVDDPNPPPASDADVVSWVAP